MDCAELIGCVAANNFSWGGAFASNLFSWQSAKQARVDAWNKESEVRGAHPSNPAQGGAATVAVTSRKIGEMGAPGYGA
jgi:hypothetical protein